MHRDNVGLTPTVPETREGIGDVAPRRQRAGLEIGSASGAKPSPAGRVILRTALPSWSWQCVLAERGLRSFPRLAGCPGAPLFHADQLTLGPVKFTWKITPESIRAGSRPANSSRPPSL
jgi:hypothetical protein